MKYLLIIAALVVAACGPKCEKAHEEIKLVSEYHNSEGTSHQSTYQTIFVCDQYAAQ